MLPFLMLGGMALQGVLSYGQAKQQALMNNLLGERQMRLQEANNAEARRAGDLKLNAVGINKNRAFDQYVNADANIDVNLMKARSAAVVAAAASGTAGMSVNDQILDIERTAAQAQANAMDQLYNQINALEMSREGIEAEVRSRTRNNVFIPSPQPNPLAAALGTGLNILSATQGGLWDWDTDAASTARPGLGKYLSSIDSM